MPSLIDQLRDIEEIDPISAFPLAIGWWVLIAISLVALSALIWLVYRLIKYWTCWKRDSLKKLRNLEKNLSPDSCQETLIFLSAYLRRIALRRFPRKECAGLTGHKWLTWLSKHDPKQFDWGQKGKLLTEAPYAPESKALSVQEILELIQAVRRWVQ